MFMFATHIDVTVELSFFNLICILSLGYLIMSRALVVAPELFHNSFPDSHLSYFISARPSQLL